MVIPGEQYRHDNQLIAPIAMEEGLTFAIREVVVPSVQVLIAKIIE